MKSRATTIPEMLLERGSGPGAERTVIRYLSAGGPSLDLTGKALLARVRWVAAALKAHGVRRGDRVLLMLPSPSEFVDAFFGSIWAGAVPVPLFPPMFVVRQADFVGRFLRIAQSARPIILITSNAAAALAAELAAAPLPSLRIVSPDLWSRAEDLAQHPACCPGELALLQYTSGSTGAPKGVALSHQNVLANVIAMGEAVDFCADDVGVSWLPLYHDMGLIGGLLSTLYWGATLISMSPLEFARRPATWLRAISDHQATLSPAPNFAFRRCLQLSEEETCGLDLSSWRVAFNGAEPVDEATLRSFARRFAPAGFRTQALYPVYGLAEHTLAVSFPPLESGPSFDSVSRSLLATKAVAMSVPRDDPEALAFACVGRPLRGVQVEIRDGDQVLAEGCVGEIVVKSPSVMVGYFDDAAATAEAMDDGWLKTGDLGYMKNGLLYVTGRKKDVIIRAGRKYYPQDIETAAGGVSGTRPGRAVAVAIQDDGEDRVVVFVEAESTDTSARLQLEHDVAVAVAGRVGFRPDRVVVLDRATLPVTSSGKLQRGLVRTLALPEAIS